MDTREFDSDTGDPNVTSGIAAKLIAGALAVLFILSVRPFLYGLTCCVPTRARSNYRDYVANLSLETSLSWGVLAPVLLGVVVWAVAAVKLDNAVGGLAPWLAVVFAVMPLYPYLFARALGIAVAKSRQLQPAPSATGGEGGEEDDRVAELESSLQIDRGAIAEWTIRIEKYVAARTFTWSTPDVGERLAAGAAAGDPLLQNDYANWLDAQGRENESWGWFLHAAQKGLPHAQVTVGWKLLHGLGVVRNPEAALMWNVKGGQRGHPEGANNAGFQYLHGIGVAKNVETGRSWLLYGACRGSTIARATLEDYVLSQAPRATFASD